MYILNFKNNIDSCNTIGIFTHSPLLTSCSSVWFFLHSQSILSYKIISPKTSPKIFLIRQKQNFWHFYSWFLHKKLDFRHFLYIFSRTYSPKTSFCKNTMSWQNIFILMANYKLSSSFSKTKKITLKKYPKIPHLHPIKKSCCPHILLFLFPYFSPIFILQSPETPILQGFKRKQPQKGQKRRGHFYTNKKNYLKKTWWMCKYTIPQAI